MSERPKLKKDLDARTFRSYYYLKQELAGFCRENGLPASGSKAELTDRIAYGKGTEAYCRKKNGGDDLHAHQGHGHRTEYRLLRKTPCVFPRENRKRLFLLCCVSEMAESKRRKDLRRRDPGV